MALPRGYFDHAAVRMAAQEAVAVGSESLVAAGAAMATTGLGGAMGVGAMAAAALGAVEMEAAATAAGATAAAVLAAVRAVRAAAKVVASEGRWASALPRTGRSRRG